MRRRSRTRAPAILVIAVSTVLVSACAGDGTTVGEEGASGPTTTSPVPPSSAVDPGVAPTTSPPEETEPPAGTSTTSTTVDDRPIAPDFTLDLGSGGTFVLSEETRPVFLVFWAEW